MAPPPDIRRRARLGGRGSHLATVLGRMAQQPERVISAVLACGPSGPPRQEIIMNHIHRISRSLASLTRGAGFPLARQRGRARRGRRHPVRTAPLDHAPAGACPGSHHRHIRAARRRATAAAGKAAHESRARPAATHHPAVHPLPGEPGRVLGQPHGRQDGAPALVPVLLRGTGPGPLRHDPVRELAPCHGGHEAQVPALGHADLGISCRRKPQRWRGSSLLTLVPTGIDDAAPGPRQATPVNVTDSEHTPSPTTTFYTHIASELGTGRPLPPSPRCTYYAGPRRHKAAAAVHRR